MKVRTPELDLTKWDFVTWIKDGTGTKNIDLIEKNLNEAMKVVKILESRRNKLKNFEGGRSYVN